MCTNKEGQAPQQTETVYRVHEYVDPISKETKTVKIFQEYCPIQRQMIWPMVRVTNGEISIGPHARYI